MKFCVLADIHGNLQALKAIISDASSKGITKFIVAGDLIADCAQPNEVIDLVRQLDAYVIKGNREAYIQSYIEGEKELWNHYNQMASVVWTAKELSEENYQYLCELPETLIVDFGDMGRVGIVHGSPFKNTEHLYEFIEQDNLKRAVEVMNVDVLIAGHSHQPWKKHVNSTLVVNPGAAGVHFNAQSGAEYAVVAYKLNKWEATHHVVQYAIDDVLMYMKTNRLYKKSKIWSELIIYSLQFGTNANIDFLKSCTGVEDHNGYIPNELWNKLGEEWLSKHLK